MIVANDNNPLKFAPDLDAAVAHLLMPRGQGFMAPQRSLADARESLRSHQEGFVAGMRAALAAVLVRFDPAKLEERLLERPSGGSLLPMNHKAKLWNLYEELYGEISREAETDFHFLFGEEFLRAYQAKTRPAGTRDPAVDAHVARARHAARDLRTVQSRRARAQRGRVRLLDRRRLLVLGRERRRGRPRRRRRRVQACRARDPRGVPGRAGVHRRGDRRRARRRRTARSSTQQPTREELAGMRATATVLAIDTVHHAAVWGHVGDTRLYCFRDGKIVAQTKDHSVVQKMVDAGYLAQTALRQSLQRSKLFAALGHNEDFVATVERDAVPDRRRRRLPAVHRRVLGVRRRDARCSRRWPR